VLIAAGIGYLARSLPLGAMLRVPVKMAVRLAPPLLLALGAAKAYEAIRCVATDCSKDEETDEQLLDLFPHRIEPDQ